MLIYNINITTDATTINKVKQIVVWFLIVIIFLLKKEQ